jgi:hypothetical protein
MVKCLTNLLIVLLIVLQLMQAAIAQPARFRGYFTSQGSTWVSGYSLPYFRDDLGPLFDELTDHDNSDDAYALFLSLTINFQSFIDRQITKRVLIWRRIFIPWFSIRSPPWSVH